jgi:hypothetical protein
MADEITPTGPAPLDCSPPNPKFAYDTAPAVYKPPEVCIGTVDYSTSECADNEANYIASLQAEALEMAAGPVNVFPMLGVHSQGSTVDMVTSAGYPLSSGAPSGYNALDTFNVNDASWRSVQQGADVISAPAFIGFSFGTKKAWDKLGAPQERYFTPEPVRKQVGSFKIRQGVVAENRATKARVEASDDGLEWKRVGIVSLPDTSDLVTVGVPSNAMYNQWRLVPIFFNGVSTNSQWEVIELHLLEATATSIDNIQDFFLMENRDRSYNRQSTLLKCQYDLLDVQSELAKFGISLPQTYIFTCSFAVMVQKLGRPIVVGDVVELPGEVQYDAFLKPVRKWLEVTDTAWATEGYAFNWKPQLFKFYAQPIMPSVEHRDLLGTPGKINQAQADDDFLLGALQNDQAYKSTEAIIQKSKDDVPQVGGDPANIMSGKAMGKPPGSYDGRDPYVQDALPADGQAFTSGDALPPGNTITAGHFHRQTYTNLPASLRPPDRLLKWNGSRWNVIEVNTRDKYSSHKRTIDKVLASPNKVNLDKKL